jgi:hypothetical protein
VGTRYFFLSPLPLVHYLEIGCFRFALVRYLQKFVSPLFRYSYFFRRALAVLPLVRYSATTIFSIVHTRGLYIGKYFPWGEGKNFQPMLFKEKI